MLNKFKKPCLKNIPHSPKRFRNVHRKCVISSISEIGASGDPTKIYTIVLSAKCRWQQITLSA